MTAPTTDDTRPDTIRDAFEAMLAFLRLLMTPWKTPPPSDPQIAIDAVRVLASWPDAPQMQRLRDLIQRAAEEHNRRALAGDTDMPAERLREMRERCKRATRTVSDALAGWDNLSAAAAPRMAVVLRDVVSILQDLPAALAWGERLTAEAAETAGRYERATQERIEREDARVAALEEERDAAHAEIERLTADVATLELKLADAQGEHGRLTAELAARAPADRPEVDAEDLWADYRTGRGTVFASDRKAFLAGVAAGRRTREPDMGAPADASLEARAEDAWYAYLGAPEERRFYPWSSMLNDTRTRWLAVVRAVDASRPEPAIERTLNVTALARCARAALRIEVPDVAAWEALPEAERVGWRAVVRCILANATPASRPGLTEEQADAIALGCLQVREDLQRHAIKRAILRASRGETGPATVDPPTPDRPAGLTRAMHDAAQRPSVPPRIEYEHGPDGETYRVEDDWQPCACGAAVSRGEAHPTGPGHDVDWSAVDRQRATPHAGAPASPFAPGSLAAGSATEDRILDRKRGGK